MFRFWLTIISLIFLNSVNAQQFAVPDPFGTVYWSVGTVFGDYDRDGFDDVYLTHGSTSTPVNYWENFLYHNDEDGTFTRVAYSFGDIVNDDFNTGGSSWGDYNNDGDLDIISANGATHQTGSGMASVYFSETKVYANNTVNFTDVTGLGDLGLETTGNGSADVNSKIATIWADYNNDGWLDVFESNAEFGGAPRPFTMFTNDHDGTFTTYTNNITSTGTSGRAGAAIADFDGDGDQDIVTVSGNVTSNTVLWRDTGTNYTSTVLLASGANSRSESPSWLDYDLDGDLDLYIGCSLSDGGSALVNHLFRNNAGVLNEVTSGVGGIITDLDITNGTTAGDFDNDGDVDIITVTNGDLGSSTPYHNRYYVNNGSGVFTENTISNINLIGYGESTANADIDNDGDLDVIVGRQGRDYLYHNNGSGNHWLEVISRGGGITGFANKTAIGAIVKVQATINAELKTLIRDISGQTGRGSHNTLRAHFGLGNATTTNSLSVTWPDASNSVNTFTNIPADKFVYVTQIEADDEEVYSFPLADMQMEFNSLPFPGGAIAAYMLDSGPASNSFSGSALAPNGLSSTPDKVSPDKYWIIKNDGLSGFQIQLTLDYAGISGVENPGRLLLAWRSGPGSPWIPSNTNRNGTLLSAAFNNFGEFAIVSATTDNSLPVELTGMTVFPTANSVTLKWETQSEIENLGFIVERSKKDLTNFEEIASYKTSPELKGQGNSSSFTKYQYSDDQVEPETTYWYRLVDVDINGARTTHAAVEVKTAALAGQFVLHHAYPNPFNPTTNIRFTIPATANGKRLTVTVYNNLGQAVKTLYSGQASAGDLSLTWDATSNSGLRQASGIYFLQVRSESFSKTQKLVLMQ